MREVADGEPLVELQQRTSGLQDVREGQKSSCFLVDGALSLLASDRRPQWNQEVSCPWLEFSLVLHRVRPELGRSVAHERV